ncbi:hypothetical protein Metlim_2363 [Methanoplanus limicola DSM 2279]|uniref:DUF3821 domain-containing protein n=2 Tax=Methanoplanus limicola TaxID=2315 RepID=H1Z2L3_9EURY|nr:hypothetical protein Metlim_2363 [Methanoplanus limicola DSM 2279]
MPIYMTDRGDLMKNLIHRVKYRNAVFAVLCLALTALPALAGETITIDPVNYALVQTDSLIITGNADFKEKSVLNFELSLEQNYDENGNLKDEMDKAGGATLITPGSDAKWSFNIELKDKMPGYYLFSAWKEGNEERVTRQVFISPAMVELAGSAERSKISVPLTAPFGDYYDNYSYITPNSGIEFYLNPDLGISEGRFAKGQDLTVTGKGIAGNDILIWMYKKTSIPDMTYSSGHIIQADEDGNILDENIIISSEDTKDLMSGKWIIYAVSSSNTGISELKNKLESGTFPDEVFLRYEQNSPYQKFPILLEEPWIRFDLDDEGLLPDALSGSVVTLSGTTNLKPGTEFNLVAEPSVNGNSGLKKIVVSDIYVKEDTPYYTWTTKVDAASFGPGEYIVTIYDINKNAEIVNTMNIFDRTYFVDGAEENSLTVQSYVIDPETKDISETNSQKNKSPISPVIIIQAVLITGIVCLALRRK